MTPQELKNSILQLAIQGKLVEQRAEEGTGAGLLEKILAAKDAKGRGNKLTRRRGVCEENKTSAPSASPREKIPDDEKPFDIPESWEWVRLGEVISLLSGRDLEPSKYSSSPKKYPYMTGASNFDNGNLLVNRWTDCPVTISHSGDLLITCKGTVGAMAFNVVGDIHIARQIMAISSESVYLNYVKVFLEYSVQSLKAAANSMIPGIDRKTMLLRLIPLPPLAEQKRIVAKIEELMPLVDRYEKAWSRLEDFNKRFPADMQKSLLQMAIQGKLVEQKADEGTGAELLEKILAAKNAEGAKGKGEKSHAKSAKSAKVGSCVSREEIPDDEKPFDIPESWEWARLGEVFAHNTGKAMNSSAKFSHKVGAIRKFITTSNLYWGSFDFANVKEMFFSEEELPRCTVTKNDILVCEGGAYYGRTAIWNYDYDMCFQNHIHRLRSYVKVEEKYFYYVFRLYRESGMMKSQGTAMPGLSSKVLHELTIPLPPLAEQKRIVAKLEELLPLCERLKSESNSAANS